MRIALPVIILLAMAAIVQWNCNRRLTGELQASEATTQLVTHRLATCIASAKRQNAGVDSLHQAGERQRELVAEAYEEGITITKKARAAADRALIEPVSAVCDSASIWAATNAEQLNRLWRKQ